MTTREELKSTIDTLSLEELQDVDRFIRQQVQGKVLKRSLAELLAVLAKPLLPEDATELQEDLKRKPWRLATTTESV